MPFSPPLRYIFDTSDLQSWLQSPAHSELVLFVSALNTACKGRPNRASAASSVGSPVSAGSALGAEVRVARVCGGLLFARSSS